MLKLCSAHEILLELLMWLEGPRPIQELELRVQLFELEGGT